MALLTSADPSDLANAARCFSSCIPPGMQMGVRTYLLNNLVIKALPPCVTPTAPLVGRGVIALSDTILQVNWKQLSNSGTLITGYTIYWGTTSGGPYTNNSGVVPVFPKTYNVTGLTAGTTYFFVIQAVTGINGCVSANSAEFSGTTTGTPPSNGLLANLVHYYDFQAFNGSNGINDSVGTQNTGAYNGGADLSINAGGIINNCVACNGAGAVNGLSTIVGAAFDCRPLFAGDGSISLSLWFWLDLAGAQTAGFPMTLAVWAAAAGGQYYFMFVNNANSVPTWRMKNNAAGTVDLTWGAAITRQAWHLAVCGYDGTAGKSFMSIDNGALIYSAAFTPPGNTNNGPLVFFNAESQNNEWVGRNDECAIWNPRALTQANINSLWNGGAGIPKSSFS